MYSIQTVEILKCKVLASSRVFQDKMISFSFSVSSEFDAVADLLSLLTVIHKPCCLLDLECLGNFADDFAHRTGCSRCLGEAEDAKRGILTVGKDLETFDYELTRLDAIIYNNR